MLTITSIEIYPESKSALSQN